MAQASEVQQSMELQVEQIQDRTLDVPQPTKSEIAAMVQSISQVGQVIEPIVVRPKCKGAYEVVVGQTRLHAVRHLGWKTIPAVVMELSDGECLQVCLAENSCRKQIAPISTAMQLQKLKQRGHSLRDLGRLMGCSHTTIQNYLSLLKLPPDIQAQVGQGELAMTTALERHKQPKSTGKQAHQDGAQAHQQVAMTNGAGSGRTPSASEPVAQDTAKLPAEKIRELRQSIEQKQQQQVPKQQQAVDPEHGGSRVLQCTVPKEDLAQILGQNHQGQQMVVLCFSSHAVSGPGGSIELADSPTMEGSILLHPDYIQGLVHLFTCPRTKGKPILIHMSLQANHVEFRGDQDFTVKLPAHLTETKGQAVKPLDTHTEEVS